MQKFNKNANAEIKAGDKFTLNGKTYEFVTDANAKVSEGAIGVVVGAEEIQHCKLNKALQGTGIQAECTITRRYRSPLQQRKALP